MDIESGCIDKGKLNVFVHGLESGKNILKNDTHVFKVTAFSPGDYVRILDSVPSLVQLQADHGEWTPEMNGAAGKIGKVIKVRAVFSLPKHRQILLLFPSSRFMETAISE